MGARKAGGLRLAAKEMQLELSSVSRPLHFHGESMRPFLKEGDEVIVDRIAWADIRAGDVVTYRLEDKFPTRRVVRKTPDYLDLWCENWPTRRFRAAREDVLGRGVARRRDGRWLRHTDPAWTTATRKALKAYRRERLRELSVYYSGRLAERLRRAANTIGFARS
jgi:hypothetical protein